MFDSSTRPRILHVIDHTASGGAQVVLGQFASTCQRDWPSVVAVLGQSGRFTEAYRGQGLRVLLLGDNSARWSLLPLFRLRRLIRHLKASIVESHLLKSGVLAPLAAWGTDARVVLHDHTGILPRVLKHTITNPVLRWLYLAAFRQTLRLCAAVVVMTDADKQEYLSRYRVRPDRIHVVPNAAIKPQTSLVRENRSLRETLGFAPAARLVAMMGRLHPVKGWASFLTLAERYRTIDPTDTQFLLVGDGADEDKIRRSIRSRSLKNVTLLGYREDVDAILRQADALVVCSVRESFGLTVLEALSLGCPVVATRCGGPDSIISDGVDGCLVDVDDVGGMVSALQRVLSDREWSDKLAAAGLDKAKRYDIRVMVDKMRDIYESVCAGR